MLFVGSLLAQRISLAVSLHVDMPSAQRSLDSPIMITAVPLTEAVAMPNIAVILKEEIARVARREVRAEMEKLKNASSQYRAQIAELKRQVTALQKEVMRRSIAGGQAKPTAPEIDVNRTRWSPAKLKRHRERLDLSAEKFGKLFDVSGQTIYNWEGGTRPGKEHMLMVAKLRTLSKRQAHAIVEAKV